MKSLRYLLLLPIFLIACGERNPNSPYFDDVNSGDNDNPPTSSAIDIFPDNTGNYWVYNSYSLDEMNARVNESLSTDSVVISAEVVKVKKKSKQFSTFNKTTGNYTKVKDEYYQITGSGVYSLESWLKNFLGDMPLDLLNFSDTSWVKVLDNKDDLWRLYRRKFDNSSIPGLPIGQLDGEVDVLASWEGQKTIKINGKNYLTEEYLFTFDADLTMEVPFLGKQTILIKRELYQYYVKNIGLVKSLMTSSSISIPLMGEIPLNGFDKEIIKYNVK